VLNHVELWGVGHMVFVTIFNALGIAIAGLGSILAWYFLGQIKLTDEDAFIKGISVVTIPNATPELRSKLSRSRTLSRIGIGFICIGSVIQIVCSLAPLFLK